MSEIVLSCNRGDIVVDIDGCVSCHLGEERVGQVDRLGGLIDRHLSRYKKKVVCCGSQEGELVRVLNLYGRAPGSYHGG